MAVYNGRGRRERTTATRFVRFAPLPSKKSMGDKREGQVGHLRAQNVAKFGAMRSSYAKKKSCEERWQHRFWPGNLDALGDQIGDPLAGDLPRDAECGNTTQCGVRPSLRGRHSRPILRGSSLFSDGSVSKAGREGRTGLAPTPCSGIIEAKASPCAEGL